MAEPEQKKDPNSKKVNVKLAWDALQALETNQEATKKDLERQYIEAVLNNNSKTDKVKDGEGQVKEMDITPEEFALFTKKFGSDGKLSAAELKTTMIGTRWTDKKRDTPLTERQSDDNTQIERFNEILGLKEGTTLEEAISNMKKLGVRIPEIKPAEKEPAKNTKEEPAEERKEPSREERMQKAMETIEGAKKDANFPQKFLAYDVPSYDADPEKAKAQKATFDKLILARKDFAVASFDKNNNGKIDKDEKNIDTNRDGKLSKDEINKIKEGLPQDVADYMDGTLKLQENMSVGSLEARLTLISSAAANVEPPAPTPNKKPAGRQGGKPR